MVELKNICEKDYKRLYSIIYSSDNPSWKQWDGPYFDDFKFMSYSEFIEKNIEFYASNRVKGIYVNSLLVGIVSKYWIDEKTRWLEVGISIFDDKYWNGGYGTYALKLWITEIFDHHKDIEHIGLTTWSGNYRMMRCSEKLNFKLEGRIRKVRYHLGEYYDSIKYGILRDEWNLFLDNEF